MTAARVRVPATSANLGPGFDAMGLALDLCDEVEVALRSDGELSIEVQGEGAGEVPLDGTHLLVRAMRRAFEAAGAQFPGCSLRCRNAVPHGRGLGSSAAAIVAGVAAAQALMAPPRESAPDRDRIFQLAADIEGHPDNVAPCVYGGFTLAWRDGPAWRGLRLDPDPGLRPVLCIPEGQLDTQRARGLLPEAVPHADAAFSAGRAGLLVAALTGKWDAGTTDRTGLVYAATEDRLHQQYRAEAMPEAAKLLRALREQEHLAAVVSGAGPSLLVLGGRAADAGAPAEGDPGNLVGSIRQHAGSDWHIRPSRIEPLGVRIDFSRS